MDKLKFKKSKLVENYIDRNEGSTIFNIGDVVKVTDNNGFYMAVISSYEKNLIGELYYTAVMLNMLGDPTSNLDVYPDESSIILIEPSSEYTLKLIKYYYDVIW